MAMNLFRGVRELESMNPSRMMDLTHQFFNPITRAPWARMVNGPLMHPCHLNNQEIASTYNFDNHKFQVNLDVQHFAPQEVTVKIVDNSIIVEGHHEEKPDDHGFISRKFTRRYVLPKEYKAEDVVSTLSTDGVLTISAPLLEYAEPKEKRIPIKATGAIHKALKHH